MKNFLRFAGILFCLFLQAGLFANTVIVKGYVKDSANHAVANRTVKIYSTDSSNQGCLISHTKITNPNGYYIDTLICNGDIRKLAIIVENCDGTKITQYPIVTTPNIVESDFIICTPPAITPGGSACKASFSFTPTYLSVKFNAAGSTVPTADSIISRVWSFGDSTAALTGNRLDPSHQYSKAGTYSVCLYIKTKSGCESSYCLSVSVRDSAIIPAGCKAVFTYSIKDSLVVFNSAGSVGSSPSDSISSRTWYFGDSSTVVSLTGNVITPSHKYAKPGSYNVYLIIKTKLGCQSSYSGTVVILPMSVPTGCKAVFTYSIKDSLVVFNSAGSVGSSPLDSTISRTWYYTDSVNSVSLPGNIITPSYPYTKPGSYTVYLVIKTKNGCESKYAGTVVIPPKPLPTGCKAVFTYSIKDSLVVFNSAGSVGSSPLDSIISRTWYYTDSVNSVSLPGNIITPSYPYTKPGSYTVYLVIKTKNGCESKYAGTVVIAPKRLSTSCKASFSFTSTYLSVKFNAAGSTVPTADSIISRVWSFGDSTAALTGNRLDPSHQYSKAGTYSVCLYIKTKSGCESSYCLSVSVRDSAIIPAGCKAIFTYSIKDSLVVFNSAGSVGSSPSDSIISRTWYYTDSANSVSLPGNIITPSYPYTKPGSYTVYLIIKTKDGCESKYAGTIVIAPKPAPTNCQAGFTFSIQNRTVNFNSINSIASSAQDTIISRRWLFGDTSAALTGNTIDPSHVYLTAGTYHVYLYIKTKAGCESKYEATVVIAPINCSVEVQFDAERISLKKVQFNSSPSTTAQGDSITQRNWKFGDNTTLGGNEISPVKEFPLMGIYNTCLRVKTANGCEAQTCKQIVVQDTVTTPQSTVDYVKIISINPNPVITRMMTTIYSRNSNVEAEISIFDIYGTRKMSIKKLLAQGNNIIEIATEGLYHGPYFLLVSTGNGKDSKAFYKL